MKTDPSRVILITDPKSDHINYAMAYRASLQIWLDRTKSSVLDKYSFTRYSAEQMEDVVNTFKKRNRVIEELMRIEREIEYFKQLPIEEFIKNKYYKWTNTSQII